MNLDASQTFEAHEPAGMRHAAACQAGPRARDRHGLLQRGGLPQDLRDFCFRRGQKDPLCRAAITRGIRQVRRIGLGSHLLSDSHAQALLQQCSPRRARQRRDECRPRAPSLPIAMDRMNRRGTGMYHAGDGERIAGFQLAGVSQSPAGPAQYGGEFHRWRTTQMHRPGPIHRRPQDGAERETFGYSCSSSAAASAVPAPGVCVPISTATSPQPSTKAWIVVATSSGPANPCSGSAQPSWL